MMGTMLQDELNAITVGIFLQVESGYMTWLNYRLLDTLWSRRGACEGTASALLCTCDTHMGIIDWEIQPGVNADSWRQLLVVLENHRLKTNKQWQRNTGAQLLGVSGPVFDQVLVVWWSSPLFREYLFSVEDKVDKEQVVAFCVVLFSTWVPLVKLSSQQEYRPTCLTPAGHL